MIGDFVHFAISGRRSKVSHTSTSRGRSVLVVEASVQFVSRGSCYVC